MASNTFDIFNKAVTESLQFENHPIGTLDLEEKILYLKGVALMVMMDGEAHPSEKEFLILLIRAAGLQDGEYEQLEAFATAPDSRTVVDILGAFAGKPQRFNLYLDCVSMATRDNKEDECENKALGRLADGLKLTKQEGDGLVKLVQLLREQDIVGLWMLFRVPMKWAVEQFTYLLEYYHISYAGVEDACEFNGEWLRTKDPVTGQWRYVNTFDGSFAEPINGRWQPQASNPDIVTDMKTGLVWYEHGCNSLPGISIYSKDNLKKYLQEDAWNTGHKDWRLPLWNELIEYVQGPEWTEERKDKFGGKPLLSQEKNPDHLNYSYGGIKMNGYNDHDNSFTYFTVYPVRGTGWKKGIKA